MINNISEIFDIVDLCDVIMSRFTIDDIKVFSLINKQCLSVARNVNTIYGDVNINDLFYRDDNGYVLLYRDI